MTRLLRMKEACRLLGVSESTLRRWDRKGKLKLVRVGKYRCYDCNQLMEFLGKRKENAVAVYARVSSRDQKVLIVYSLKSLNWRCPYSDISNNFIFKQEALFMCRFQEN